MFKRSVFIFFINIIFYFGPKDYEQVIQIRQSVFHLFCYLWAVMMRIWIALIEKVNNFKNIIHAKKEVWNVKWDIATILNYQRYFCHSFFETKVVIHFLRLS